MLLDRSLNIDNLPRDVSQLAAAEARTDCARDCGEQTLIISYRLLDASG